MRGALLVFALAAVALAHPSTREHTHHHEDHHDDEDCHCEYRGLPDPQQRAANRIRSRLEGQKFRMDDIQHDLEKMDREMHHRMRIGRHFIRESKHLRARVEHLLGHDCDDHHFQCGGDSPECIHMMLVCDGSPDCHDGQDEHPDQCEIIAHAGTVLEARLHEEDTCTKQKPFKLRVVVGSATRVPWFQYRVHIRATILISYHTKDAVKTDTLNVEGFYCPAHRRLHLEPPKDADDNLSLTCQFDGVHNDRCRGSIVHELTNEPCMEFGMRRVHL